jgi:hypothetical protein
MSWRCARPGRWPRSRRCGGRTGRLVVLSARRCGSGYFPIGRGMRMLRPLRAECSVLSGEYDFSQDMVLDA